MNCPVCKRDNAYTLSICPSCGTMINDSVREELITKITPMVKPIPKPDSVDFRGIESVKNNPIPKMTVEEQIAELNLKQQPKAEVLFPAEQKAAVKRESHETTELDAKHTNRTLVEFHNKNAKLPEWRLQLKNAVRNRTGGQTAADEAPAMRSLEIAASSGRKRRELATSGANALKADQKRSPSMEDSRSESIGNDSVSNPKLAAALKRIEKSREKFLESEKPSPTFGANSRPNNTLLYFTAKPNDHLRVPGDDVRFDSKIATSLKGDSDQLDTNKLPVLPKAAAFSTSFEKSENVSEVIQTDFRAKKIEIAEEFEISDETVEIEEIESAEIEELELQEIDDCAPLAMRFNAGLFDLIIGSFASLLLLTPFMAMGGEWFTLAGLFAFLATTAIVMFIYLTTAVGRFHRTFGMRLFSLDIIDIEGEDYPSIHQAAVSACVYLISLGLGGLGFLTLIFNDENRALHDIVSKTIVVKEF